MPAIEHVSIEDVYPWEDEYGNEFLSRDYSTKENQKYLERLAESMRAKAVALVLQFKCICVVPQCRE